jgi:hypothetical protein
MHAAESGFMAIHDAKNDLTAAVLLLERAGNGGTVDVPQIQGLIRRAVERMDDFELDSGGGWESVPRAVGSRSRASAPT